MEGRDFNEKLAWWLKDTSIFLLDYEDSQERIFDVLNFNEDLGLEDEESEMIQKVFSRMLKLSFIMKNNKEELEKLITYFSREKKQEP